VYSNKQCTPPPEGEASTCDRIALQKEYVQQQVMCVTFTTESQVCVCWLTLLVSGGGSCRLAHLDSRLPAAVLAVLVHPTTIVQATRCSPCPSPPSPFTPSSLPLVGPLLTFHFDSFPDCKCQAIMHQHYRLSVCCIIQSILHWQQ
jgi:hypothetical protein